MFPNLDAEMARRKITKGSIAEKIHKTPTTLGLKLNGRATLTLPECIEIRDAVDKDLSLDYLFATEPTRSDRGWNGEDLNDH